MSQKKILERVAQRVGFGPPYSTTEVWYLGPVDRRDREFGKIAKWAQSMGHTVPKGQDAWIDVYMGGSHSDTVEFTFLFMYPYADDDRAPQIKHTIRRGSKSPTSKTIEQALLKIL